MTPDSKSPATTFFRSRSGLVLLGFLGIAAFFLFTEHRAHVLGALPYLLILACPLMHVFHGGHGGHGDHDSPKGGEEPRADGPKGGPK